MKFLDPTAEFHMWILSACHVSADSSPASTENGRPFWNVFRAEVLVRLNSVNMLNSYEDQGCWNGISVLFVSR